MITLSMWFMMGGAAGACTIGGLAVMAAALTPGRDGDAPSNPPPAGRSQAPPRPGYVILAAPGQVAPWQAATHPEPWPAIPDHLLSDQRAQLDALGREVDDLHGQAVDLFGGAA